MEYAEVVLPLPLSNTFTYRVPDTLKVKVRIGFRVLVPFGRRKYYTGIVTLLHDHKPEGYEVKEIMDVLDTFSVLRHPQLKFWQWIADYYLCSLGEVYKAAVPAGMKVESETQIVVNEDFLDTGDELREREQTVYNLLHTSDKMSPSQIAKATGYKDVMGIVAALLEKEAVRVTERIVDNYSAKTEAFVAVCAEKGDSDAMHVLFDKVARAKKQEALLLAYLDLSHWMGHGEGLQEVPVSALLERAGVSTRAVLKDAVAKGVFRLYKKEVNRFAVPLGGKSELKTLSAAQQKAYEEILDCFREKDVTLLRGVTSSGKTEVYAHLIDIVLKKGMQVLYLVPEIALTTQLTRRLQRIFGNRLLIYHSKFSDNERVDIWKRLLQSNEPCVVIGVRSSVFLPFGKLGLVIVDEEHETSYKQQEPAPRYNARQAAMVLASMHGAKTLLGTATPLIETYYLAKSGRYGLVELLTRFEDIAMPQVEVVDTIRARKRREMDGMFSSQLVEESRAAVERGEQVILFQNRRGFSPMVRCKECAWVPKCENCDVSLTYHKRFNHLSCHYCGYTISVPTVCPVCGSAAIEIVGYGTERIEDEVGRIFPDVKISRMDLDTTRSKNGYEKIIDNFSEHRTQMLVGTQMVTKGLDFEGVSVVGILNADNLINFPDFRSHERAFNMLEQVAGRAGRKHKRGKVVVQTAEPQHAIIRHVVAHDYTAYYKEELEDRRRYGYPPFTRIINIYLKHRDDDSLTEISTIYSGRLRQVFGHRVLGPEAPAVKRVQQLYIRQIVLKMELTASMSKVKQILREIYVQMLNSDSRMKGTVVYYDVDPM